jgi:TRAP-type C4-dicarboxylate transport system permease small subunit
MGTVGCARKNESSEMSGADTPTESVSDAAPRGWRAPLFWLERALGRVELTVAALALVAMLGLSLGDIVGRNFLHTSIPHGDVLLRHLVLWVALPGAALAVIGGRHLALDPANLAARAGWQRATALPFNAFAALVCGALTHAAWRYWVDEAASVTPAWLGWLTLVLPLGLALLALHFGLRAVLASGRQD